jgi:hypothetical protein
MRVVASIIIIALGVALGIILVPVALGTKFLRRSLWDRLMNSKEEEP